MVKSFIEMGLDSVLVFEGLFQGKEKIGNMGRLELSRLGVFFVVQFCFVFGIENLNKYSLVVLVVFF